VVEESEVEEVVLVVEDEVFAGVLAKYTPIAATTRMTMTITIRTVLAIPDLPPNFSRFFPEDNAGHHMRAANLYLKIGKHVRVS
jgi:hypothetical protein